MSPPDQVSMVVDPMEKAVKQLTDDEAELAGAWSGDQAEYNSMGGHDTTRFQAEYDDSAQDGLTDAFHSYYTSYSVAVIAAANQIPGQFSSLAGAGRTVLWNYLGADGAAARALTAALGPPPK